MMVSLFSLTTFSLFLSSLIRFSLVLEANMRERAPEGLVGVVEVEELSSELMVNATVETDERKGR